MLTIKKRRLVFYLLVLLFIIVSPVIIAYAMGYTIDFSRGSISKVGGVFVKSARGGFSVYLDGKFQKETSLLSSGALLTGLQPRNYDLRIEKEGFKSWVKDVKVDAGIVAEIRDVLLVPDPVRLASATKEELYTINLANQKNKDYKLTRGGDLLDLRQSTSTPQIIATKIKFFEKAEEYIFLVNQQGFLARLSPLNNSVETIGRLGFFIDERPFKFSSSGDYIFIIDSVGGGYLLYKNELKNTFHSEILGAYFDKEDNKILLVRKDGLEVVWLTDNPRQPFQKTGDKEVIFTSRDNIKDARWFFGTNKHLIIHTDKDVLLASIKKGEDSPVVLADGPIESISAYPELPDKIFIKKKGVVYKIEL